MQNRCVQPFLILILFADGFANLRPVKISRVPARAILDKNTFLFHRLLLTQLSFDGKHFGKKLRRPSYHQTIHIAFLFARRSFMMGGNGSDSSLSFKRHVHARVFETYPFFSDGKGSDSSLLGVDEYRESCGSLLTCPLSHSSSRASAIFRQIVNDGKGSSSVLIRRKTSAISFSSGA